MVRKRSIEGREGPLPSTWGRIVAGAVVAPFSVLLVAPVAMVCIDVSRSGGLTHLGDDLRNTMGGAVAVALGALLLMLVVGVPAYLIAVRLRLASIWTAGLAGILAACALPVLSPAHVPFAAIYELIAVGVMGAVVGVVFWLFVRPAPNAAPPAI